ncbi:MAG: hypothetical protein Q8914_01705 [Bacteroidota bacterium]|nr:hypothetical protein [Bacteroidota bacterium]
MKNRLAIFLLALLAVSCDRSIDFDTISVTPPSLTVQVEGVPANDTYPKIDGATVNLYNSSDQLLATGTTNANGRVTFTKAQLVSEGTFKAVATKGTLTGDGTTPYMLLNDGETLLIVTIE